MLKRFWIVPYLYLIIFGLNVALCGIIKLIHSSIFIFLTSSSILPNQISYILSSLVILTISFSCTISNFSISNQSSNSYFHQYSSTILTSLPPKALFLVNYDQLWTSVRFEQMCLHKVSFFLFF